MKYTFELSEAPGYTPEKGLYQELKIVYTTETGYVGTITVDKAGMTRDKIIKLVEADIKEIASLHKATLGA
jgi:hypothetical protein